LISFEVSVNLLSIIRTKFLPVITFKAMPFSGIFVFQQESMNFKIKSFGDVLWVSIKR
jgi:hypothetical protein